MNKIIDKEREINKLTSLGRLFFPIAIGIVFVLKEGVYLDK